MGSLVRTIGRLAAVLAIVAIVTGLTVGRASAERPGAAAANLQIAWCVAEGGEPDVWIRPDGVINVTCKFDDHTVFCQYDGDTGSGGCMLLDRIAGGDDGSRPDDGNPFHIDERAAPTPTAARDKG
jgi:hypothetical protein